MSDKHTKHVFNIPQQYLVRTLENCCSNKCGYPQWQTNYCCYLMTEIPIWLAASFLLRWRCFSSPDSEAAAQLCFYQEFLCFLVELQTTIWTHKSVLFRAILEPTQDVSRFMFRTSSSKQQYREEIACLTCYSLENML